MGKTSTQVVEQTQSLEQAFGVFNDLSQRLTTAYGQLESRVTELTRELAAARRERCSERAQREHLADQLGVLLEALPAAIVLVDRRDRVDRFNPAAEQLFPGLAWGRRWTEVKSEVVVGEPAPGDWQLRDGRRVSVSQRPLNDRGRIMVVVDVTEQRQLHERVERRDRLSAMGEMAAQLAHQVRTPLATSVLYAGQLAKGSLNDAQRQQFSDNLLEGLRHTETLVRDMLAFSRGGSFNATPISIADALNTAIAGLQPRLQRVAARLTMHLDDIPGQRIAGNLDALAGAFSNLIDNALNHGGDGVAIDISARVDADAGVTLAFEDDGPGIDPLVMPRILDPFFTTRERGTGLGLAVVHAVVLEHAGSLEVGNAIRGGARFEIRLPLLEPMPTVDATARKQAS